jgi:signal transduction histidine kinase
MDMETMIPCTATGVGVAREAIAAHLPQNLGTAVGEDARLLTSEAVTNAVRHSGGTTLDSIALRMRASDEHVLIEVEDPGGGFTWPPDRVERPGPGGYGLRILDEIAEDWGVRSGPPTVVWFELRRPHRSST